jgi:DNA glycosylase AlkZ-like
VPPDVLSRRALGRATLGRQLLLERAPMAPVDAVAHLVGLQAQVPRDPYLALWSRLDRFDPVAVGRLIEERALVRTAVMRSTIHLVTADDCLWLRPLVQPVLDAELVRHRDHAPHLRDADVKPVLGRAAELLAATPMTPAALGRALAGEFPALDGPAMAYACRNLLALVQVPPRGVWRRRGQVTVTTAESWLGRPLAAAPSIEALVDRYLTAFGPALPADLSAWSRLTGFREVLDRMAGRLRSFHDERGRQLVDVPDAPLPDEDTPAPVRFLPEYDNALLSHADRTRYTPDDIAALATDGPVHGTALVDGTIAATWSAAGSASATMTVRHLRRLRPGDRDALATEGERMLRFLEPDAATFDVRLLSVGEA